MYQIDGKVFLQTDGGPIGLELSGSLARVIMLLWDQELLRRLDKAAANTSWDLFAYLRYVDDGNMAANEANQLFTFMFKVTVITFKHGRSYHRFG